MSHKHILFNFYESKEDFVKKYEKLYHGKPDAKELYLLLLMELKMSVLKGNIDSFKKLILLVDYITDCEGAETLKEYFDSMKNPIKDTNLIILACKHNKLQILRCVLSDCKILSNLSINIGKKFIVPDDVDEMNQNSFYYAIYSGNIDLLDILISNWPGNYFDNLIRLDEILSTAYEELKLKNILLSDKIEIFVESKLLNLRFFSDQTSKNICTIENDLHNIKERVRLVLENNDILQTEYLNAKEVDQRFLFIAKFVAQNIHVLKRQLKSTYDRLPWEEIEFCLVSFVSSQMKQHELNLFIHSILNKDKILNYLDNFAKKLEKVVEGVDIDAHSNIFKLKREKVVLKIIDTNPEFENLYHNYQQLRDIHSLEKINKYVKLALAADPEEKEGQLIITRVLQVIGEYLKNSLESPKLSDATSERLLLSLPKNTRKIIIDLRNSLSHAFSLYKRTEIEENGDNKFFMGVQSDAKKVGDVINDVLYVEKIKLIRTLLNKILASETLDEIKDIVSILNKADMEAIFKVDFIMMEQKKLEELVKEFFCNIPTKTSMEQEHFNKINKILISIEKNKENVETDYIIGFAKLKSISYSLNDNNKVNNYSINKIKFDASLALKNFTSKLEPQSLKCIAEFSRIIFDSAKVRIEPDKLDDVHRIMWEIFCIAEYEMKKIKWIEQLRENLNDKKYLIPFSKSKSYTLTKEQCTNQLKLRLFELKNILSSYLLNNQLIENFHAYKSNTKLQAVIEMLVLDIMSILSCSKNYLENNLLTLDSNMPLLTGKCLRNHLAHYNDLIDLFLSDPMIAVILNAKKLASENLIQSNKKIGMPMKDNPLKLEDKFNQSLLTISNQNAMFVAIEEGNIKNLKSLLSRGADINARNINLWSTMHFAAKGTTFEVVEFILEQTSNTNGKDINGQTPLHIASAYGRSNIVEYFLKNVDLFVDEKDIYGRTPLHFAAQNGHNATVVVLLQNKANVFIHDMSGLLPLYYAIRNCHIDVVNILLEKNTNIDLYETIGGFTPLHEAAESGNIEIVNFLLQKGANVNAENDRLWTPLHAAARNGYPEVVNALILNSADVNARVINGCTSLHYAVETNQEIIVDVLLKHGVEVNVFRIKDLISPLHIAAINGHKNIVKTLLKHGANSRIGDVWGMTPLHFAAEYGFIEIVSDLLENGIYVNTKNKDNYTPLHYAAMGGHTEIVALLLKSQATVNVKTIKEFTPLHIAASKGHQDVVDLLIKNNAEVDARNKESATPLHWAVTSSKNMSKLISMLELIGELHH